MKKHLVSLFTVLLFVAGCVPAQYSTVPRQRPVTLHKYELYIVDVNNNPLNGVKIDYNLKDNEEIVKSDSYITTNNGKLSVQLMVNPDLQYSYLNSNFYKSDFSYEISKDGYYSKSGKLSKFETDSKFTPAEAKTITLIRPIDYFDKTFALTVSDIELKTKLLQFIDLLVLQGLVSESVLETQSINLASFKTKNYLKFKFTNINVYNSLKLDKYDIGKRLFDEVIRKILSPLNEYIGNSDLFYGYDLIVIGHTKSFAEEYASSKPIEYRFLIPEKVVRKYKDKDITGQQVLDASAILMDDERIELKLQ